MAKIFTNRDGTLRLYDGTGTPFYLKIIFSGGDLSAPIGNPETEEILKLDRGVMDSNAHYIEGGDETIMEPLELSFTAMLGDIAAQGYLLDWLDGSTVNSNTIATTKGTTQRDGATNNPAFAGSGKKCCNVEFLLNGSTDLVYKYAEVRFKPSEQQFSESADGVTLSLKGLIYGTITRGTSFTAGTDVTA